jgi:hypothetical protein
MVLISWEREHAHEDYCLLGQTLTHTTTTAVQAVAPVLEIMDIPS